MAEFNCIREKRGWPFLYGFSSNTVYWWIREGACVSVSSQWWLFLHMNCGSLVPFTIQTLSPTALIILGLGLLGAAFPLILGSITREDSGWSSLGIFSSWYAHSQINVEEGSDISIRTCARRMWVSSDVTSSGRY